MNRVCVEVWSDYVCPFCYLEEPVLDRLRREHGKRLSIRWRAFELRPEPVPTLDPKGGYLRDIWARAVYPMAEERGMFLRLPPLQPRSRIAHEAAQFAGAQGRFAEMNHAIFRAFFEYGHDIGDAAMLAKIFEDAGFSGETLHRALAEGRHRATVLDDEAMAARMGISGVPALLLRREGERIEDSVSFTGAAAFAEIQSAIEDIFGRNARA